MFGPVFAERLLESGATFAPPAGLLGIECEFGFRLGRNFPIGSETLSIDSIRSAVAECFPTIEIAGRRVPPSVPITEVSVIADLCFAVAVVRGPAIPHWQELDLCTLPVTALIDGAVVGSGDGRVVLGNPLAALLWLAEALVERGRSLRQGDLVVTGSCTGIAPIAPGQRVEARFSSVASVRLDVT
jgi:2-keto-4-pentenoate hydratase